MNPLLTLLLLQPFIPLQDSAAPDKGLESHRHILTTNFPLPDSLDDPELRKLLKRALADPKNSDLFKTPAEREHFLKWTKEIAAQKNKSAKDLWKSLMEKNPELSARLAAGGGKSSAPQWETPAHPQLKNLMHRIASTMREREASGSQPHSATAHDLFKRFNMKGNFEGDLSKYMERSLTRFQKYLNKWDSPSGRSGESPIFERAAAAAASASGGSSPAGPLGPALPSSPLPDALAGGGDVMTYILGGAVAVVILVALLRWRRRTHGTPATRVQIWKRPVIPAQFESVDHALDTYRDVMRYALQRPLTGLSHLEIEWKVVEKQPAAASSVRTLTSGFESLFYDPAKRLTLDPADAHRLLEALSARP